MTRPRVTRIGDFTGGRDNNFNLLRFLAASLVVYSHAYPLTLGPGSEDPWSRWTGESLGVLAVNIFFVTSGFLVTKSLLRHPLPDFVRARILRIYPGLIVALIFCAFIVGPLLTRLDGIAYWRDPGAYTFLARNFLLLGWMQFQLPGVFESLPTPSNVNGSLWTLPWEMRMYTLLVLLGWVGRTHRAQWIALLGVGAMLLFTVNSLVSVAPNDLAFKTIRFTAYFFGGGAVYVWRDRIVLHWVGLAVAVLLAGLSWQRPIWDALFPWILIYVTFALAYLPRGPIRKFNQIGDYSYGIYIYAFPVQQIVVHLWPDISVLGMCVISFAGVLPLAVASWYLVEKPMLARKPRPLPGPVPVEPRPVPVEPAP